VGWPIVPQLNRTEHTKNMYDCQCSYAFTALALNPRGALGDSDVHVTQCASHSDVHARLSQQATDASSIDACLCCATQRFVDGLVPPLQAGLASLAQPCCASWRFIEVFISLHLPAITPSGQIPPLVHHLSPLCRPPYYLGVVLHQ
jgi:hypothetical protein